MKRVALLVMLATAPAAAQTAPDPATLARRVDSLATSAIEKGPLAGLSIVVMRGDRVLVAKGYGFADLEHRIPATAETIYEIGSITKQFTALAVMQLVEQKKLSLADDAQKLLPDVPLGGRKITVARLLDHTSGLKNYTSISRAFSDDTFRLELSTARMAAIIAAQPPDFAPGTNWSYTNSGFFLAGMIIEKLSGQTYAEYLRQHIFEPNGLTATSYCNRSAIVPGRAKGYQPRGDGLGNADPISMTVPFAAGALCSSALDLARYQRALVSGKIVSRASYQRMSQTSTLADGWRTAYGLGLVNDVVQGARMVGHGGQINGFWTVLFYYPVEDLTVVLLSNVNPANGESLWSIGFKLGDIARGFTPKAPADLPVSAAEQARVAGKYTSPLFPFEMVAQGDHIAVGGLGPEALPLARQADGSYLAAWDPTFHFVPGPGCRIRSGALVPLVFKCEKSKG